MHGYFTKQPYNVVNAHIQAFTQTGDLVLDPFGGAGVTLIESLILGRRAIHIDLNPLSQFIVENLLRLVDYRILDEEYTRVSTEFERRAPKKPREVTAALKTYSFPRGRHLPKNADVETVEELFSKKQLAQLAFLKHLIVETQNEAVRKTLLLMFSGLINKINLTYHASKGRSPGRGDSGVFRYYRYRIAPDPPDLSVLKYFALRYGKVLAAKKEIQAKSDKDALQDLRMVRGDAADLSWIPDESVDYIFTDPPYGAKIPYLDLSIMWIAWLDLDVMASDYAVEAIEGGEKKKTRDEYAAILKKAINEMARVLKFNRWMSFVFAHQNPSYWYLIVHSAEAAGFEYAGAVRQGTGRTSYKKRQNPLTVLSGELVINFKKVRNPKTIGRFTLGAPIMDIVINNIEAVIARNDGATIEEVNDELVLRGLELGFLDVLAKEYSDLTPLLKEQYDFDGDTNRYHLKKNTKFRSQIPLEVRVRYFVVSLLRRMQLEATELDFDTVVLSVMPLLKNGVTPEKQPIRAVLEEVAERTPEGRWRLRKTGQFDLFV